MQYETAVTIGENMAENASKMSEKHIAFFALRKEGHTVKEACKVLGYNTRTGYYLDKKVRDGDLTDDYWLSLAAKAMKNVLKGKPFGEVGEIKGSDVMAALKMIYDRKQPAVKRSENMNLNATIDFVDLEKYRT